MTGVKRDIALLRARGGAAPGDLVTVLDVSLDRNRAALLRAARARRARALFRPPLRGRDPGASRARGVTSTLGAGRLHQHAGRPSSGRTLPRLGRGRRPSATGWTRSRSNLGAAMALGAAELEKLRELGRSLNYNAYGETEADLLVPPATPLSRCLPSTSDPLQFVAARGPLRRLDGEAPHADLGRGLRDRAALGGPGRRGLPAARCALEPARERHVRQPAGAPARTARDRGARAARGGGYIVSVRVPPGARLRRGRVLPRVSRRRRAQGSRRHRPAAARRAERVRAPVRRGLRLAALPGR